jgi:cytoskeletal protein CcmA (bactofilin family)
MATSRQAASVTPPPVAAGVTVIGTGIHVNGRVTGEEDLHVQGRIDGSIVLSETLFVAPGGVVVAEVEARDIVVSGVVVGNVTARECVTLNPGAKLVGDIGAPRLVIADGAAFSGNVRMGGEAPPVRERSRVVARVRPTESRPAPPRAVASESRPAVAASRRPPPRPPKRAVPAPAARDDDEDTVVVRHAELKPDAARPATSAPVEIKKKAPPRARMPKPGKRRVGRR